MTKMTLDWTRVPYMLASTAEDITSKKGWIIERKYDGGRRRIIKQGNKISFLTRGMANCTLKFPEIKEAVYKIPLDFVLDCEFVREVDGKEDFPTFIKRDKTSIGRMIELLSKREPMSAKCFDILEINGESLLNKTLAERKEKLGQLQQYNSEAFEVAPYEVYSEEVATKRLEEAKNEGREGIMIKNLNAKYDIKPNIKEYRSVEWLKMKTWKDFDEPILGYTTGTREMASLVTPHGKVDFTANSETRELWEGLIKSYRDKEDTELIRFGEFEEKGFKIKRGLVAKGVYLEMVNSGVMRNPILKQILKEGEVD